MHPKSTGIPAHTNNFDFLRILLATLVLITHSYALTGLPEQDILWKFSSGQAVLSKLAVLGFFVISGFLIFKSLLRSQSIRDYYFKRIIRVFPALWVVVGITVICGYFFSSKNLIAYITDSSTLRYLLNLILRIRGSINGVFEHNAYPSVINGSLWTVPYEVLWYILLTPLFFIKNRLNLLRSVTISIFLCMLFLHFTGNDKYFIHKIDIDIENTVSLGIYFISGAVLALFPRFYKEPLNRTIIVCVTGAAILLSLSIGGFNYLQYILMPLFIISFGSSNYYALSWVRKYGDISYGVYIWGFPIQQTIWYFLQPSQPMMLVVSVPATWIVGFLSWHLIEKRVLRLKLNLPVSKQIRAEQLVSMSQ